MAGADEMERRLACLRECGFSAAQADKVFEAVDLPAIDNIRTKLADLEALGFRDPVKMITSSPAILGISRERLALVCRIVLRLDDGSPAKISQLVMKARAKLDAIDAAEVRTWAMVRAMLKVRSEPGMAR